MKKNNIFYCKCGNWVVKIVIEDAAEYGKKYDLYIEAATRAIDLIFGCKEWEEGSEDELLAVYNENGDNVLDDAELDSVEATYTLLTDVFMIKRDGSHKLLTTIPTSDLFLNASLHDDYRQAIDIENELDDEE